MKKPMVLFRCIAEALVKQGIREWVKAVPGGEFVFNVIKDAHDRYREQRNLAEAKEDIIELIQADPQTVQLWATEAASQSGCTGREQQQIETYLMQIPAAIRQSQKRPDDPSGRTLSGSFQLAEANDLAKLLPPGPPRFIAGDDFPGKGGWKLERLLGIGGFGEVWLARHRSLASLAPGAVKFCRNGSLQHEAKVIDRLLGSGKHANIVTLNDADLERDEPWLLYDYIEGGDLGDCVHCWAGLAIAERQTKVIETLTVLASAIGYFHGLTPPIVHRDLKPANILRDQQDKLYITDFGIGGVAAQKSLAVQSITTTVGKLHSALYGSHTPLYASPQQKAGGNPSPQDDVHALGVIGYQLLTGQMEQGVGSDLAEDLAELGVTGDLIVILKQCTAQKAERRYANAQGVLTALQGLKKEVAKPEEAPKPATLPKPEPKPEQKVKPTPSDIPKTYKEPKTGMEFVWVEGGRYQMGSQEGYSDENPAHLAASAAPAISVSNFGNLSGRYQEEAVMTALEQGQVTLVQLSDPKWAALNGLPQFNWVNHLVKKSKYSRRMFVLLIKDPSNWALISNGALCALLMELKIDYRDIPGCTVISNKGKGNRYSEQYFSWLEAKE